MAPEAVARPRHRNRRAARASNAQRGDRDGRGPRIRLRGRQRRRQDRQDREGDRRDHPEGDDETAALRPVTARTAEVAVFAGVRGPARTFSYLVPDGLDLVPGHLVRVGLGSRAVPGVVIALDGAPAGRDLRPVDALVHPLPLLRPHQLALASWIAERYRCGLADAVRAMLPPALASRARNTKLAAARGERTEAVFAL